MKKIITLLIAGLALMACRKPADIYTPLITPIPQDSAQGADTVRSLLALGDSYTIGQSVAVTQRFPVQTVAMLNGVNIPFSQPEIIAQTGWTTANLLTRLNNTPPEKAKYDVVTLLIGVNNQYQGRSQEEYRQQFTTLLERAISYAGNRKEHVFVLSIPDYSVTPFAAGRNRELIAAQIDSFNAINKSITELYQVTYTDITADSRQAAIYPSLIANDGLHPSGEQYNMWAAKLTPAIRLLFE